jgi:hypothetical protein
MTEKQYFNLLQLLNGINRQISKLGTHPISQSWLTKTQVKQVFGYSENSLRCIEKYLLISKKRGRKFYSTKSVIDYIELGIVSNEKNDKKDLL